MERDELVRLAGEQALLSKEITTLSAAHTRDKAALLSLYNDINASIGRNSQWLQDGIALLTRLHDSQSRLREMNGRLLELQKLTGL